MANHRIAARYAKALLGLAVEKGELEKVFSDMQWLLAVCNTNKEFVNMLRSPIIKPSTKTKIVKAIAKDNIGIITEKFMQLLITKGRETILAEISKEFISEYKAYKNIHIVTLTTATPVSEEIKNKIVQRIKANSKMQNIELDAVVKEDIIGGFMLQAGDLLVDASVSHKLKDIARQFENNDFIYRLR